MLVRSDRKKYKASSGTRHYIIPATVAGGKDDWPRDPAQWLAKLRDLVDRGADMPIAQAACEKLERFREPVRAKMWTFVLYVLARHPDRWPALLQGLTKERPTETEMAEVIRTTLDREVGDVETEWRAWVRSGSRFGAASGLPR